MKPYIICHMTSSVDGRIDCPMTEKIPGVEHYYETLDALDAPTRVSGRITATLEMAEPGFFDPKDATPIGETAHYKAQTAADGYNVVCDNRGRLLFKGDTLDNKPLLLLLSEQASKEYLGYLEGLNISYIVCGKEQTDLVAAMDVLRQEFCVERLAVVGGAHICGAFLEAGLIDEVSICYGSVIDGREGMPGVFDGRGMDTEPVQLQLKSVQQFPEGMLWIRYDVKN